MPESTFTIRPKDEFVPLMNLLQIEGVAETGGQAKIIIDSGIVKVNGAKELQKRKKLRDGDVVEVGENTIKIKK